MPIWKILESTDRKLIHVINGLYEFIYSKEQAFRRLEGFDAVNDLGIGKYNQIEQARLLNVIYKGQEYSLGLHFKEEQGQLFNLCSINLLRKLKMGLEFGMMVLLRGCQD